MAVSTLVSCVTTTRYAVFVPQQALDESRGCFRLCQAVRGPDTAAFLRCVRTCPNSSVNQDARCQDFPPNPYYVCMPEETMSSRAWKIIVLIGGLILLTVAATAFVPQL